MTESDPEITALAQITISDLDETTSRRFAVIAQSEGKSAEDLAREIISRYADVRREEAIRVLDEIRKTTIGKTVLDPVRIIREDRDRDHEH
jgi:plasmid stability protein